MRTVTEADVRGVIVASLAPQLLQIGIDPESVPDDIDLIARGVVDSLGLLELIAEVEDRFGLELDFEGAEPEQLTSVGGLCAEIAGRSAAGPAARS